MIEVPGVKLTGKKSVVFCIPIVGRPYDACMQSLEDSLPLIEAAGYTHGMAQVVNSPYISAARATMLRAALDSDTNMIVFIDYDMAWRPQDLLKLIETEGDVVAGTYRCKIDEERYMGTIETNADGTPQMRADGCIRAKQVPAGFLKVTKEAVDKFMVGYPDLCYGPMYHLSVDLFNHGVRGRLWYGEDYMFSLRWRDLGEDIWLVPDLDLNHHSRLPDGSLAVYPGNFHRFLCRQPGGSDDPERVVVPLKRTGTEPHHWSAD